MIIGTSGCSIYRMYKQPDMKTVTDNLFRHIQEQTDTVSIAALSWREIFTDSQLQQLIDTGLKNNTDLNIARLKVKEAEALLMNTIFYDYEYIIGLINRMDTSTRILINLLVQGKSYKEIGHILCIKEGTVKSRIHNIRKKIKDLLPEYFQ